MSDDPLIILEKMTAHVEWWCGQFEGALRSNNMSEKDLDEAWYELKKASEAVLKVQAKIEDLLGDNGEAW